MRGHLLNCLALVLGDAATVGIAFGSAVATWPRSAPARCRWHPYAPAKLCLCAFVGYFGGSADGEQCQRTTITSKVPHFCQMLGFCKSHVILEFLWFNQFSLGAAEHYTQMLGVHGKLGFPFICFVCAHFIFC